MYGFYFQAYSEEISGRSLDITSDDIISQTPNLGTPATIIEKMNSDAVKTATIIEEMNSDSIKIISIISVSSAVIVMIAVVICYKLFKKVQISEDINQYENCITQEKVTKRQISLDSVTSF